MDIVTLEAEWWADAQGNPVPFGSPDGVCVLYGAGARVPSSVAESLKALSSPPADKAVRGSKAVKK